MKNLIYKISAVVMLLVFAGTTSFAQIGLCPGASSTFFTEDETIPALVADIDKIADTEATYVWTLLHPDGATDVSTLITLDAPGHATDDATDNIVYIDFPVGDVSYPVGVYVLTVTKLDIAGNNCEGVPETYNIEILDMTTTVTELTSDASGANFIQDEVWCPIPSPHPGAGTDSRDFTLNLTYDDDDDDATAQVQVTNITSIAYSTAPNSIGNSDSGNPAIITATNSAIAASGNMTLNSGVGSLTVNPVHDPAGESDFLAQTELYAISINSIVIPTITTTAGTYNNVTCDTESVSNMINGSTGDAAFNATFLAIVSTTPIHNL